MSETETVFFYILTVEEDVEPLKRSRSYELLPPDMEEDVRPLKHRRNFKFLPTEMSELRVVLLGNSWSERNEVGNFLLRETVFNTQKSSGRSLRVRGRFQEMKIVVINTPDLLLSDFSHEELSYIVQSCVTLSAPGPHVFLLVLQPEDFTEDQRLRLHRVLETFSERSFDNSLVLISTPREKRTGVMENYNNPSLQNMIRKCRNRHLKQKNLELSELLTHLGQVVKENNGEHVRCDVLEDV
ncbi:GTPase IMAP family member 2-like, partial [Polymixia lowei]